MESLESPVRPRKPGRPLSFDRDRALGQAMLLFWRHGYETTSVSDLTAAMGITAPSLYATFGDKKALFLEAVRLYCSGPVTSETILDGASTARDAVRGLLLAAATGFTGDTTPRGCLLASATASCSESAADVQAALSQIRRDIETRLRIRIERAIETGEMPAADARTLAAFVMTVIQGLSTLARDGAARETLVAVAETALTAWP